MKIWTQGTQNILVHDDGTIVPTGERIYKIGGGYLGRFVGIHNNLAIALIPFGSDEPQLQPFGCEDMWGVGRNFFPHLTPDDVEHIIVNKMGWKPEDAVSFLETAEALLDERPF
jgi:hypothetical protein